MFGNTSLFVNVVSPCHISVMRQEWQSGSAIKDSTIKNSTIKRREMCFACPPRRCIDGEQSHFGEEISFRFIFFGLQLISNSQNKEC